MDQVNALNVYPVPDGDTGTNMLHTLQTALEQGRMAGSRVDAVAAAVTHGALMGARGNSGVILSQILRGLKDATADSDTLDGRGMALAFALAKTHAFAAVTTPAPGTMLTVLATMRDALRDKTDVSEVLRTAVDVGRDAVALTREQNPTNAAAGVVDAGAFGLLLLLEGALDELTGTGGPRAADGGEADGRPASPPLAVPREGHASPVLADWKGAYDVQFLIERPVRTAEALRRDMLEFGADCVLVVGDESVVKVHVHTTQPDQIVRIGLSGGRISDVVVEDLDAMAAEHERATGIVVRSPRAVLGLVAVVPGEGFADIVRAAGGFPVRGVSTPNPSVEQILEGVSAANAEHVVLLPNDADTVLAAEQAAGAAGQAVTIVRTRNIAQGMAAMVSFDPAREPALVAEAMERARVSVRSIEVARAARDTSIGGRRVRRGAVMGLLDGRLVAQGDDEIDVLCAAASELRAATLLTVFYGSEIDAEGAERVRARLRATCGDAEVEVLYGGQPHYPFVVAVE